MATTQSTPANGPKNAPQPPAKPESKADVKPESAAKQPAMFAEPEKAKTMDGQTATQAETAPAKTPKRPQLTAQQKAELVRGVVASEKELEAVEEKRGKLIQQLIDAQGDRPLLVGGKYFTFRKRNRTQDDGVTVKTSYHVEIVEPEQIEL